jgi:hypothetical protein
MIFALFDLYIYASWPFLYGNCSRNDCAISVLVATHTPSFAAMYFTKSCQDISADVHTMQHVLTTYLQGLEAPRPTDDPAVKSNGHHLRRACFTLFVQNIEGVLDMGVKPLGIAESLQFLACHSVLRSSGVFSAYQCVEELEIITFFWSASI